MVRIHVGQPIQRKADKIAAAIRSSYVAEFAKFQQKFPALAREPA